MSGMLLSYDGFEEIRQTVIDGADGEPIAPPDKRKGWCILHIVAAQCPTVRVIQDPDDEDEVLVVKAIDRASFIYWGLPKKGAVATPPAVVKDQPKKEDESNADGDKA